MSAPVREAALDYIKGLGVDRPGLATKRALRALLALGALAGVVILVIAEFSPVFEIVIGAADAVQRTRSAGSNHSYALLVIAILAIPMALGAARGARPPAAALSVIGIVALVIALTIDLPDTSGSGRLPESVSFEDARAQPAVGFYLETLGAIILIFAGGGVLLLGRDAPRDEGRQSEAGDEQDRGAPAPPA